MTKKQIRKRVLKNLNELSNDLYEKKSKQIAKTLYNSSFWKNAKVIGITISRFPEVNTYEIIEKAWKEGKTIVIPKCDPQLKEMTFRTLNSFDNVETVYYGLSEPIVSKTNAILKNEIDLQIVPGVVYNKKGFRIGFGGGYYDRYLKDYKGKTISLAFSLQIINDFPIEKHDIPVQKVITEQEVIIVGN